jgi:hypothetical protein
MVRNDQNRRTVGIEATYGPAFKPLAHARWVEVAQYPRLRYEVGFMDPNEDKVWRRARPGSMLVYSSGDVGGLFIGKGARGYLRVNGLFVRITSPSEKLVVSAARALRPAPSAGNGAGG